MKKLLLFLTSTAFLSLLIISSATAQFDLEEKLKQKADQKGQEAVDEVIDKGFDDMTKKKENKENQKTEEEKQQTEEQTDVNKSQQNSPETIKKDDLKSFSKFDFIPGDKVIFFDDFAQDNVGDFPTKWNTNSGGEVLTFNNVPGKWLHMNQGAAFIPEFTGPLPDNFTIEYDAMYNLEEQSGSQVQIDVYGSIPDQHMGDLVPGKGGFSIRHTSYNFGAFNWFEQNYGEIDTHIDDQFFTDNDRKPARVSIWVQKQRVRVYAGEKKIIDVPRMVAKGLTLDKIRINTFSMDATATKYYFTNFRVAVGQPDMRNKLITEGKFVTHGIYFDSGSDKIKPESYGTLKEIASILSQNADVKVRIDGHTDSDGNDASNLDLSKRRAASVKTALSGEFGIDGSRMQTDGKGETQPIDNNTTSEGKANNRRVEFIKL